MSTTIIFLATQRARAGQPVAQPIKSLLIARLRTDVFNRNRFEVLVEQIHAQGGLVQWAAVRDGLLSSIYTDLQATGPADLVDSLINL